MSAREIITDLSSIACALCLLVGSLMNAAMIKKVNARLPKEQQLSYFDVRVVRMLRLPGEYRRFYPDGKMYIALETLGMVALLCALCGLWLRFAS